MENRVESIFVASIFAGIFTVVGFINLEIEPFASLAFGAAVMFLGLTQI
jgi:hypothetical protein